MSWLRPQAETRSVTLESILGQGANQQPVSNWTGIPVTPRTALAHPAVYRCRTLICGKLAGFPWLAYQRRPDRSVEEMRTQPKLLLKPSGMLNLHSWKWQAVESLVFDGNIVGQVVARDDRYYPTQVELVPMSAVMVRFTEGRWSWRINGKDIEADDIWHVALDPPPGHILGTSLLEHAATSIATGLAAGRFSSQFYGDGGNPTLVMRNTKKTMTTKDMNEVKERVVAVLRGRREPLVIGSDWEVKPWQMSPADAQLIGVWARNSTDVASYFGVPPEYVGGTTPPMTYSNLGARRQDLVALCFTIWGDPIEVGLTDALPRPVNVRISYDEFLRGDADLIAKIDASDLRSGVKSPDEVRLARGLPPIPGGAGQVWNWPPGSTTEDAPTPEPAPAPALTQE